MAFDSTLLRPAVHFISTDTSEKTHNKCMRYRVKNDRDDIFPTFVGFPTF